MHCNGCKATDAKSYLQLGIQGLSPILGAHDFNLCFNFIWADVDVPFLEGPYGRA